MMNKGRRGTPEETFALIEEFFAARDATPRPSLDGNASPGDRHQRPTSTDPISRRRVIRSEIVANEASEHVIFDSLRQLSVMNMNVSMTLTELVTAIGDRWARGLDPTSTGETFGYGLKLRVLPTLGHLPVTQSTAGVIDHTIDAWETRQGASTIKYAIALLVRVLDEAVRDGLITIRPAKNHAKGSLNRNAFRAQPAE
ncbi:hypothetical protein SOM11_04655 [Frigoribacterium sp. CFBP9039]|uniref:hypothetical protein n=1 Tax=Frigoribacterium sp. CFBP9029 TaxID=3096541 RepID=UPI002A6A57EC|nr:hypothetical protein [Frigoribacterium sp. CFBP9039]MDY0945273.1 hypothetical protein [Frigoribacterium sp. CFBP9039]